MTKVNPFRQFMTLVMMSLALSACANLNPLSVAQTPEQKYAAVKLGYDALLTPAVQLIQDESVPVAARRALQTTVAQSGEVYKSLNAAYVDYLVAKQTFTGADKDQRLAVVAAQLDNWIKQLEQHTNSLATALKR